jgi:hypothetical protein
MSATLGPVLATGMVTIVNTTVFHGQPMDWRVPVATGLAAVGFGLMERAWPQGATILAWSMFLTLILTRTNPAVPSPTESALAWWNTSKGK